MARWLFEVAKNQWTPPPSVITQNLFNSIPKNKILDWFKFRAFADNINVNEQLKFSLRGVENIVGKGENAGYQHFFLFPRFRKASFWRLLKVGIVW